MKLKCDEPLSNSAFNFNLRRYNSGAYWAWKGGGDQLWENYWNNSDRTMVGRCRLTVSKPVLKAPMVSALEATI